MRIPLPQTRLSLARGSDPCENGTVPAEVLAHPNRDLTRQFDTTERRASVKPITQELARELAPRIMRAVVKRRRTGCWERTKYVHPKTGYTRITKMIDGKLDHYLAHRVMYVAHNGPIPDGLTIDHLCVNPPCCNPAHLRAVPHRENVLRGERNPFAVNSRKSKCKNGHPFDETTPRGRRCSKCRKERAEAARQERKRLRKAPADAHGTSAGYGYWCCRCNECKAWQQAKYRASKGAA